MGPALAVMLQKVFSIMMYMLNEGFFAEFPFQTTSNINLISANVYLCLDFVFVTKI